MKRIVIFASGSGTNFQSVIDAVESGRIKAKIAGLIASKQGAGAVERAKAHNIPVEVIPPRTPEFSHNLLSQLIKWNPDLIVLAGYLSKIPHAVLEKFENRIINIHPSLLPKYGGKGFFGMRVHKAVIESGDAETGCSVHIVTDDYDEGPVLEQTVIPVRPDDTPESLAERVLEEEHKLLPKVIANIINENQTDTWL